MKKVRKTKVFIDAFPLAPDRLSGIGHLLLSHVREFDKYTNNGRMEFILVASPRAIEFIKSHYGFKNIKYKKIPIYGRIFNGLVIWRLMPPVDLYLGRGIYLFFNYTKWPLLFSKSITFIHDLSFIRHPGALKPDVLRALKRNIPSWAKKSTIVATISQNTKSELIKYLGVNEQKIKVVYAGVDTTIFYKRDQAEIKDALNKYHLPANYILYISNLEPRKGVDVLLDAYIKLPTKIREYYSLIVMGADGWKNEAILAKINNLQLQGYKIIRPSQYVQDSYLPAILSGAKVLVHPAIYEGFGISPLQAVAVDTNIVVADNSSLKEIYSKVGLMFKTGDVEDLKKKIIIALTSTLNKQNREQVLKQYSWEASNKQLMQIIETLAE